MNERLDHLEKIVSVWKGRATPSQHQSAKAIEALLALAKEQRMMIEGLQSRVHALESGHLALP
jgi:hypothetical protein